MYKYTKQLELTSKTDVIHSLKNKLKTVLFSSNNYKTISVKIQGDHYPS